MKTAHEDAIKARRIKILEKYCVTIRVGDVWTSGDKAIKVLGFSRKVDLPNGTGTSQADFEGAGYLPWPLVLFCDEEDVQDFMGAPGFKFCTLVQRGHGNSWEPKEELEKLRADDRKKKEKEDAKRDNGRTGYQGPPRRT